MKVSGIQSSQAFTGRLCVKNLQTGVKKDYFTNAIQDSMLRFEAKQCVPVFLGKIFRGTDFLIPKYSKAYIEALEEVTQDPFIKELPKLDNKAYFRYEMKPDAGYNFNIYDNFEVSHHYE